MIQFVYALKCANSKWYVGQTTDIARRFLNHKEGSGSAWTKVHKAESIVKLINSTGNDFLELATTLEFMDLYGIDNVRGSLFSNVHMPPDHVRIITKLMISNSFPKKWVPKESDAHLFAPQDDCLEEPDVLSKRPRIDAVRHGLPWSQEEENNLLKFLSTTYLPFDLIASTLGRTEGSIRSKVRDIVDKKEKSIELYSQELKLIFTHDGKSFKRQDDPGQTNSYNSAGGSGGASGGGVPGIFSNV